MNAHLALWIAIAVAGGLTLALRLLPLLGRGRRDSEISPTMDRFNRAFLACCIASMVVGMLFPAGFAPRADWPREAAILGLLAVYLLVSRFHAGPWLAPVLALAFVAFRTHFS